MSNAFKFHNILENPNLKFSNSPFLSTAELSVSSPTMDCLNLVNRLKKAGIDCNVTSNITIQCGEIESGCKILTTVTKKADIMNLWNITKTNDVTCGYLKIDGGIYNGCILNFLAKTKCPWK